MKTIIVPQDFSKEALIGLEMAIMIANKTETIIQLIHVLEKADSLSSEELSVVYQLAKLKFVAIIEKYKPKDRLYSGLNYNIKEGKLFKQITNFADICENPLIVLSTHGESGFEDLFIGGNAYKITSHSRCPVITVRSTKIPSTIKKIVLPIDMSFQTREKVPYTVNLAKLFNAEINIVTVRLSNFNNIDETLLQLAEQVASYIGEQNISYTIEHLIGENLTDLTIKYAQEIEADLISIMTEQEKSISNFLLGNYAHQMITKSPIPVLSFPNEQIQILEGFRTLGRAY